MGALTLPSTFAEQMVKPHLLSPCSPSTVSRRCRFEPKTFQMMCAGRCCISAESMMGWERYFTVCAVGTDAQMLSTLPSGITASADLPS